MINTELLTLCICGTSSKWNDCVLYNPNPGPISNLNQTHTLSLIQSIIQNLCPNSIPNANPHPDL